MPFGNPTPITPGLRTAIVFDKFLPSITQPFFAWQRDASEMARGRADLHSNVAYTPGIGFMLRSHHLDPNKPYELTDAQSGFYVGADATIPSAALLGYTAKTETLSGVTYYGKDAQSNPVYRLKIPSGGSWHQELGSDKAAYPGADTASDTADMDRMFVCPTNHDPRDFLTFNLHVPGSAQDRYGNIGGFYFCGPAGQTGTETGTGQYELKLNASGLAVLWERVSNIDPETHLPVYSWLKRYHFQYSDVPTAGMAFYISVGSDSVMDAGGGFQGTRIAFRSIYGPDLKPNDGMVNSLATTATMAVTASLPGHVYKVPQKTKLPTQVAPVRIDVRRGIRAGYMPARHVYPATGTLVDDTFTLPFHPRGNHLSQLEWYGARPTGTTLEVHLYREDTGVEVIGTVTVDDAYGQVVTYRFPDGVRSYHVEFVYTTDGTTFKTPVLTDYAVYRSAVLETPDYSAIVVQDKRTLGAPRLPVLFPVHVHLSGPTEEPEAVNMALGIDDLGGINPDLPFKTGTPVRVEFRNPADDSTITVAGSGIIQRSTMNPTPQKGRVYPAEDSYKLEIDAAGEWARFKRRLMPYRWVQRVDTVTGLPMKATDAIFEFLKEGGGYTDGTFGTANMIDVADLPQRLFTDTGGNDMQIVQPGTPAFEPLKEIVADYTGGYLLFDENAGGDTDTLGMWRLLLKHRPPYNNLLKIFRDGPTTPKMLPHDLANYPDVIDGGTGQVMKCTYGIHGTESKTFEPAEGNFVQVFGGSDDGSSQGGSHPGLLTQVAFNPVSFNYFGLSPGDPHYPDPTSPDFLGELVAIQVYDYTLCTQAAVDWVTRRVFDSACFGREVVKVTCPIQLVTDILDPFQVRLRLPRFNDPVLYQQPDGSFGQYLVVSCTPSWSYDGFVTAEFELVTTSNITSYGLPIGAFDYFDLTRARIKAAKAASGYHPRSRQSRQRQRTFSVNAVAFTGWPSTIPTEIQWLDPAETDPDKQFGDFKYMADYDPVP